LQARFREAFWKVACELRPSFESKSLEAQYPPTKPTRRELPETADGYEKHDAGFTSVLLVNLEFHSQRSPQSNACFSPNRLDLILGDYVLIEFAVLFLRIAPCKLRIKPWIAGMNLYIPD
jgi:hypothetical protein